MTDERGNEHLAEPEVALLLERLEKVQAVVVGGQALAIWSRLFLKEKPSIASFYSISSEDLDVYGNAQAAKVFAATLDEAEVHVPKPAHLKFNIDPRTILNRYLFDVRLDSRWRNYQLKEAIAFLGKKADAAAKRISQQQERKV